jgi:site-specific recombinase XerD
MKELFEQFIREKIYLKNVSPKTVRYYRDSWAAYQRYAGEQLNKNQLAEFVIKMRQAGVKPVSCNTFISGINVFLSWMHENGHLEKLVIKKLVVEQQVVKTLDDKQLKAILTFKPETFGQKRIHTLLCFLLDTGCRIEEALTLKRTGVDMDNLLVTVIGKGSKERIIPFSVECRKLLFKFLRVHSFDYVFPTRDGGKMSYHNLVRDYKKLCKKAGIEKTGNFHRLRHTFATNYLSKGGGEIYLSNILGHTTLAMTRRYAHPNVEALQAVQQRTSILGKLR